MFLIFCHVSVIPYSNSKNISFGMKNTNGVRLGLSFLIIVTEINVTLKCLYHLPKKVPKGLSFLTFPCMVILSSCIVNRHKEALFSYTYYILSLTSATTPLFILNKIIRNYSLTPYYKS